jgi:MoaA/NifB/PqqE/SkfB family radical SAM enzyme
MKALVGERTLHWRINCPCNRRCSFCYGPQGKHEVKFEEAAPIVEALVSYGVRRFVLTGGEPLLSKKVDSVLELLHGLGADVALYTNCDFFDFHEDVILRTVDTLCVPLDGGSEYTHDDVRGRDSYRAILSVLDRHAHGGLKFKVGTVIGRHNIGELDAILYTLARYKIESWKLYEFLRYEDRELQKQWATQQLGITDAEYRSATGRLLDSPLAEKVRIVLSSEYDRANSYFMMNPDLEIILPYRRDDGLFEDLPLCDARETDPARIEELWLERVDSAAYEANVRQTFAFA